MSAYVSIPQDVLFFRDARPMAATTGSGGHGARWPEPSVIFDAIHAALYRAFPAPAESRADAASLRDYIASQNWEWQHAHRYVAKGRAGQARNRQPAEEFRNQRFGALKTAGPFPCVHRDADPSSGIWLFPAPADFLPDEDTRRPYLCPLRDNRGSSDLRLSFLRPLGSPCEASKDEVAPWWSKRAIEAALANRRPADADLWQKSEIYEDEWSPGIGIDPKLQVQDGEHIYSAQYLRLKKNVALGFSAALPPKRPSVQDGLKHLFPTSDLIICGGQQRACRVMEMTGTADLKDLLPMAQTKDLKCDDDGKWRIKWMLLSPAVFPCLSQTSPGGWLPNWIAAKEGQDHGRPFQPGDVLLKPDIPQKRADETRESWRRRVAKEIAPIKARLVAARIPKPVVISGWSELLHVLRHEINASAEKDAVPKKGARQTLLAVPAGAVYYFESESAEDARALAAALNWHGSDANPAVIKNRRSALLGEKGFGLGVCGTWKYAEDVAGRSNQ